MLGLDQVSLGGQHRAEGGGRVGPEPASARADPAHRRLRLLGVVLVRRPAVRARPRRERASSGRPPGSGRPARSRGARAPAPPPPTPRPARRRRTARGRRRPEPPVRISFASASASATARRPSSTACRTPRSIVTARTSRAAASTYASRWSGRSPPARSASASNRRCVERAPADQHRGRRGRHRKLRMLDDPLLRQRPNPAQKRPAGAAPDQRQVILDQELRRRARRRRPRPRARPLRPPTLAI